MIESKQSSNIPSMSNKQHYKNMNRQSITGEDITDMTINRNDYPATLEYGSWQAPKMNQSIKPDRLSMNMIPDPIDMKAYNEYKQNNPYGMGTAYTLCRIFSNEL